MTAVLQPPDWIGREAVPWQPRRRALLGVAVVVVLLAGWVWTGLGPTLVAGEVTSVRGLERSSDDVGAEAWQVTPTGGQLVLQVRNDGRVPVTLSASQDLEPDVARVGGFADVDAEGRPTRGRLDRSTTVGAGAVAHVVLQAGVLPPYCRPFPDGLRGTAVEVVLTARTLGLPTTQRLPLPLPVQVVAPSPACR